METAVSGLMMGENMHIKEFLISDAESVKEALKKLDRASEKVLLVIDKKSALLGTITDGDIRRYILSGKRLDADVRKACNESPITLRKGAFSPDEARRLLVDSNARLIPVVDSMHRVYDLVMRSGLIPGEDIPADRSACLDIPVVIMAGGKSTRMEPFSKIFPKPLIPIGDKAIVEVIIDEFRKNGAREFYMTLNYKADMIESYFNHIDKDYEINFVREDDFYGTAGSLKLLEKTIEDTFIVSNCDIIVKADFEEVLAFHRKEKAVITILSSIRHYKIPYGVVNFRKGGEVTLLTEKPEYTFTVNTGIYVMEKSALRSIKKNKHTDMTDLIKVIMRAGKKVIMYPVNENDYVDVGQWDEYKKAMEKLV